MIPLSQIRKTYDKCKPLFQSDIKNESFDINLIIIGNNSSFDSLDYLTFIMQLEEDILKKYNFKLDLTSIEDLPDGNISINQLFEIKNLDIIFDEKN